MPIPIVPTLIITTKYDNLNNNNDKKHTINDNKKKNEAKLELEPEMGYLGKVDEARRLFEKIYRS